MVLPVVDGGGEEEFSVQPLPSSDNEVTVEVTTTTSDAGVLSWVVT